MFEFLKSHREEWAKHLVKWLISVALAGLLAVPFQYAPEGQWRYWAMSGAFVFFIVLLYVLIPSKHLKGVVGPPVLPAAAMPQVPDSEALEHPDFTKYELRLLLEALSDKKHRVRFTWGDASRGAQIRSSNGIICDGWKRGVAEAFETALTNLVGRRLFRRGSRTVYLTSAGVQEAERLTAELKKRACARPPSMFNEYERMLLIETRRDPFLSIKHIEPSSSVRGSRIYTCSAFVCDGWQLAVSRLFDAALNRLVKQGLLERRDSTTLCLSETGLAEADQLLKHPKPVHSHELPQHKPASQQ